VRLLPGAAGEEQEGAVADSGRAAGYARHTLQF
jgi:hypothetical protein